MPVNSEYIRSEIIGGVEGVGSDLAALSRLLKSQANIIDGLLTKSWPVHHVEPPQKGTLLLYAEDGWGGTFDTTVRVALRDAFDSDEHLTLAVWTLNESTITKREAPYVQHEGKADSGVIYDSDGNQCVRFVDGTLIDIDDIVAVRF